MCTYSGSEAVDEDEEEEEDEDNASEDASESSAEDVRPKVGVVCWFLTFIQWPIFFNCYES